MKTLFVGLGAAGGKCISLAVEKGVVDVDDTMIINTTSKDFPKDYTGTTIRLTDSDQGCGKEREVAKKYAKLAMKEGKFNVADRIAEYVTVVLVTSVSGGSGSGSTPLIAKMFNKVYTKNVHIVALTGFEDDARELANTVEFFKEIDPAIIVHTISNKAFLSQANGNNLKAEELANNEFCNRISVITGQDFIEGSQNIDDTDILKLANTAGYMAVEKKYFNKSLETRDDYEKIIKNMVYNSASIKSKDPSAIRLGIILNISDASKDAVDYSCTSLREAYGNPYEFFKQVQWDGKKEYIAFIASGMKMPIDEIEAVYERYKDLSSKINKAGDDFFAKMNDMDLIEEDSKFNMIKDINTGMSITEFLDL